MYASGATASFRSAILALGDIGERAAMGQVHQGEDRCPCVRNFRITHAGATRGASNSRRMSPYNWWRFCFFNSIGSHSVKRVNQYLCIEISVDTYNFAPTHSNHMYP
jgi:hypothetical protein